MRRLRIIKPLSPVNVFSRKMTRSGYYVSGQAKEHFGDTATRNERPIIMDHMDQEDN